MSFASKLKTFDFYRKIPRDLSEATLPGSVISMLAAVVMIVLFVAVRPSKKTETDERWYSGQRCAPAQNPN